MTPLLVALLLAFEGEHPGAPARAPARVLGEVTKLDAAGRRITLKTDAGQEVTIVTDAETSVLRAQPGARDLTGATPVELAEIALGDRVLARGARADEKTITARQVVVMGRADIAQKQEQERAEWRRRGVSGVIKITDPVSQEITIEVRSLKGSQTVVVATADRKPDFKRYAPASVRFSDARPSTFAELQLGDQVRVLGDRTPDGSKVVAEQVVSGAFQIVSGAVKAVDALRREVRIVGNETGKPLTVTVDPDAVVRRLPPEMAARLARRSREAEPPEGNRGMGTPTLQDTLEGLPPMPIEELKPGDQVAVSSPTVHDPGRVTAAVLVAGIEPLLEARPRGMAGGGETLGLAPGVLDLTFGVP
jgi:PAS domain-containing protein